MTSSGKPSTFKKLILKICQHVVMPLSYNLWFSLLVQCRTLRKTTYNYNLVAPENAKIEALTFLLLQQCFRHKSLS